MEQGGKVTPLFERARFIPEQLLGHPPFEKALEFTERRRLNNNLIRRQMGITPIAVEPSLLLFSGPRRSGKTHLVDRLSLLYDLVHVEKDPVNALIASRPDDPEYIRARGRSHDIMHEITNQYLDKGLSVAFDTPHVGKEFFPDTTFISRMHSLAARHRVPVKVVWCIAERPTRMRRLQQWNDVEQMGLSLEALEEIARADEIPRIPFTHIVVDTAAIELDRTPLESFLLGPVRLTREGEGGTIARTTSD